MEFAALTLTAFGLTLAWYLYRSERRAARHADLDGALAVLRAVESGMIGPSGWGRVYFEGKSWDDAESDKAADEAALAILAQSWNQVLIVPTEPLVLLVGSGELLRDETVAAASNALWRLHVFNQFIRQQAEMVANHAAEIAAAELTPERRSDLSNAFAKQARMLHLYGIGEADVAGGWYRTLKDEVRTDINHLTSLRGRGFFDYEGSRWFRALGDFGFPLLLALIVGAWISSSLDADHAPEPVPAVSTSTSAP